METLKPIIDIVDNIKSENGTIKQAQLDEIKLFVCLLKRIWFSLSIMQKYDLLGENNPSFFIAHGCHFYMYILLIIIVPLHL
jgi:hypothetical protein